MNAVCEGFQWIGQDFAHCDRCGRSIDDHEGMGVAAGGAGLVALRPPQPPRRAARIAPDGTIVRLPDQDRALWDRALIDEGQQIVRACIRRDQPGPYQLQAAIAAVHSDAATPLDTDWVQVLALYDHLLVIAPSSVVELNRAIALAEVQGPEPALRVVNGLGLDDYHLLHAVRADLLHRLGHDDESRAAYDAAIALTTNPAERDLLIRRRP